MGERSTLIYNIKLFLSQMFKKVGPNHDNHVAGANGHGGGGVTGSYQMVPATSGPIIKERGVGVAGGVTVGVVGGGGGGGVRQHNHRAAVHFPVNNENNSSKKSTKSSKEVSQCAHAVNNNGGGIILVPPKGINSSN